MGAAARRETLGTMFTTDPRLIALRDSLAGRTLKGSGRAQYILREQIGEGGQGWVFTANWDEPGGFVVVVKVLRPDAVNADTMRRFQREADVLRMLSQQSIPNPHIVRFFDHATASLTSANGRDTFNLPFTVLEYVNGTTLEKVVDSQTGKGLGAERTRRILRQVSQALELVHQQKVTHRDLKPSNILLAVEAGAEIAKVTDFGLVKLTDVSLQRTTTLAGASLGYAPPEQYEQGNQRVGPRTDVFSLAAITYEMLAGKMAFPYREGENPLLIVTRILNHARPSLLEDADSLCVELRSRPDLIALLDTQIAKALAPDPGDRHTSISEFFGVIEPVLRMAAEARSSSAPPANRNLQFSETIPASTSDFPLRPSQVPVILPAFEGPPRSSLGSGSFQPISMPQPSGASRPSAPIDNPWSNPRPIGDTSNPSLWTWRVATQPVKEDVVRGVSMGADNGGCVAIGPAGLARWERGQWLGVALPGGFDPRRARGVTRMPNGDYLIFGDLGLALHLAPSGAHAVLTTADPDATYHGAHVDPDGTITLVGDRPSRSSVHRTTTTDRVGVVVQYQQGRLAMMADVPPAGRLRAVTRTTNALIVACGESGAMVRVHQNMAEFVGTVCTGDLAAIAPLLDGQIVAVGSGGHALTMNAAFATKLEAVQTTRDLLCVGVTTEGTCWAGAQQARLLRRTGDSWVRMSGELGLSASIVGIGCTSRAVIAVCTDGGVIEGQLP